MTTITALPTPPSTSDPANFNTRANEFLGALPAFVTQTNELAADLNGQNSTAIAHAAIATAAAAAALSSQTAAAASANSAAASASSAFMAPGTNSTSSSSLSFTTGSVSLTTQTGKQFALGNTVKIAYTTTPTAWMLGTITAYDSGTGAMTVYVDQSSSSGGPFSDWIISIAAPGVPSSIYASIYFNAHQAFGGL